MSTSAYMGALVCSSVFVFGNPYTSAVPAGNPSPGLTQSMCGIWALKGNNHIFFHVEAHPLGYSIKRTTRSGTGNYTYKGWTTEINGTLILNLKDGERHPEYMLYKLDIGNDQLILTSVSSLNEQQFSSSQELCDFLAGNLDKPGFLDVHDRMLFTRVANSFSEVDRA